MILADLELLLRLERLTVTIGVVGVLIAVAICFVGLRIQNRPQ